IMVFKSSLKSNQALFTYSSDMTEEHMFSTDSDLSNIAESHNALEVLHRIQSRWNADLDVNAFSVKMVKSLGIRKESILYEYKNIRDIEDISSMSSVIT